MFMMGTGYEEIEVLFISGKNGDIWEGKPRSSTRDLSLVHMHLKEQAKGRHSYL